MNRFNRVAVFAVLPGLALSGFIGWYLARFAPSASATAAYTRPGELIAPLLTHVVPQSFLQSIVPEGGAAAYVLLILLGSFVFWALVLSMGLAIATLVLRRPNQ